MILVFAHNGLVIRIILFQVNVKLQSRLITMIDLFIIVFFEIMFRGPGYLIVKLLKRSKPDENGFLVILVSLLFWFFIGFIIYVLYSQQST